MLYMSSRLALIPCETFFCVMRVFPARFSPPACSLSTLPVPNLPVEPDSWITGPPFVSDHKLLYLPAPYRPCLFPSNLLRSTPGKLTCWLCRHHPRIDWETRTIQEWGASCHSSCLKQAAPPCSAPVINSDPPDLTGVLPVCHNLRQLFSKTRATFLPPHRPYDCTIDLLPGTARPKGRLYSLSEPERKSYGGVH